MFSLRGENINYHECYINLVLFFRLFRVQKRINVCFGSPQLPGRQYYK